MGARYRIEMTRQLRVYVIGMADAFDIVAGALRQATERRR